MSETAYETTLKYLFERLPMFSRIGGAAYKADLSNTIALCEAIDHPEKNLKCIHIAGTNGKGSVSHMLASILQEAGFKTGLYTSPHLHDFRERIRINGQMVAESQIVKWTKKLQPIADDVQASFFEMTVALAFAVFNDEKTDIAIIETGMGGRLDSTNVIQPLLSIITHIALDHQQFLGDTLAKIAAEKAGIIKPLTPILIGRKQMETTPVFVQKANEMSAPLLFAEDLSLIKTFDLGQTEAYLKRSQQNIAFDCPLRADYQQENIQTVLSGIEWMNDLPFFQNRISKSAIEKGITNVLHNTGFRGRWEILQNQPLVIADVAHNEEGIAEVMQQIKKYRPNKLHIVYGTVADKAVEKILPLFPEDALFYFTEPSVPRKMEVEILVQKALVSGLHGQKFLLPKDALAAAKAQAGEKDVVIVTGSFFVVCDVLSADND